MGDHISEAIYADNVAVETPLLITCGGVIRAKIWAYRLSMDTRAGLPAGYPSALTTALSAMHGDLNYGPCFLIICTKHVG